MRSAAQAPVTVTHARVWKIAGPIVLSNATVALLGAVDTGVVGQMG
jgi:MATE family multidrug resistance protein